MLSPPACDFKHSTLMSQLWQLLFSGPLNQDIPNLEQVVFQQLQLPKDYKSGHISP